MDEGDQLRYTGGTSSSTRRGVSGTSIHITALDGITNVNSLFTLAVFLGLAWNPYDPTDGGVSVGNCAAGPRILENLVSFHVYSFASFLFSSLVALCLKQAIRLVRPPSHRLSIRVNRALLRAGIIASAIGSVLGCGFLMLALVNVVQIKLGRLGCAGAATVGAIVPLVTLIPAAMIIYIGVIFYAFTR
ncbi:uncharacterized protein LOC110018246 [Phalaenopsis equestris]|uniref:uncharacterized protein LOC110018246 n=1 Tax=Phalaenopsis equestris TaxID=78828 RepID=UPI0009E29CFD|nr:uncharacterized protein LOC110018246 [Phalaenopsis equestris]